eukprot:c15030_g1_i1.p1 GENE.c15030_g1_i1~~c15030_g1_i1.p1  ORF type:complete len:100 (-),score=24.58 c15030_g1_i1:106-405(-)
MKMTFFFVFISVISGNWINSDVSDVVVSRVPWENIGVCTVWLFGIYIAMSIFLIFMTRLFDSFDKKRKKSSSSSGNDDKHHELQVREQITAGKEEIIQK